MSHTHLLYHIVFATKDRTPLIDPNWERELHAYIAGIVKNLNGRSIEINGTSDHIHLLAHLSPKMALSDVMRELKASSSRWVHQTNDPKFSWQRRYGAFTVSESACETVRHYIRGQKAHHQTHDFETEYTVLLTKHRIEFEEQYLWT